MATVPSVGDILMLSQQAWRIGRAFTQHRRKSAVPEFSEVESEANGLSEALKLMAEALYNDRDHLLTQADGDTQHAVSTILESAHKTLSDLESFVERYRVIKKKETATGFAVERAFSEVVVANYRTLKWTTEGGDINELRSMLHMHTDTLNLTMHALQSSSLARLERTVIPMAGNVAAIHDAVHGDLSAKMDDLHRAIMSVSESSPMLGADRYQDDEQIIRDRGASESSSAATIEASSSPLSVRSKAPASDGAPRVPIRNPSRPISPYISAAHRGAREDSAYYSMGWASQDYEGKRTDWGFEGGHPPTDRSSIGATTSVPPSGSTAVATPSMNTFILDGEDGQAYIPRRESLTVPHLFSAIDRESYPDEFSAPSEYSHDQHNASLPSPSSLCSSQRNVSFTQRQVLPPPAIPSESFDTNQQAAATPLSFFRAPRPKRVESNFSAEAGAPPDPQPLSATSSMKRDVQRAAAPTPGVSSDVAQNFEKALFRNAAILCDVRGTLLEYAQKVLDEPDPRYDTEMVEACKDCRIFVIRKRESQPHGGYKVYSSIWVISDDGKVRVQQRLSDMSETVPYCSYFQPEKVSLPPTDSEDMTLSFHSEIWADKIVKEARSNWINYIFESEEAANLFQSAIFGRTLLGSFRTTKTTVIHDGFKGAFAFEEQFANIEVLRLWEDDGIATPGAGGGVLALMHLGSNFGEGWARWWMNSSKQHVRVKDEQSKFARIKGIDIRTVRPGEKLRQAPVSAEATGDVVASSRKKALEKRVTGVRIEFKNEEERARFVELARRVQGRMLALPDV